MILEQLFNSPLFWVVIIVSTLWIIPLIIVLVKYSQGFPSYRSLSQYGLSKVMKMGIVASGVALAKSFEDKVYDFLMFITGSELSFFGLLGKSIVVIIFTALLISGINYYIGKLEKRGRDKERREKEVHALAHADSFVPKNY